MESYHCIAFLPYLLACRRISRKTDERLLYTPATEQENENAHPFSDIAAQLLFAFQVFLRTEDLLL